MWCLHGGQKAWKDLLVIKFSWSLYRIGNYSLWCVEILQEVTQGAWTLCILHQWLFKICIFVSVVYHSLWLWTCGQCFKPWHRWSEVVDVRRCERRVWSGPHVWQMASEFDLGSSVMTWTLEDSRRGLVRRFIRSRCVLSNSFPHQTESVHVFPLPFIIHCPLLSIVSLASFGSLTRIV